MKRIVSLGGALLALGMLLASCNMGMSDGQVSGDSVGRETSNINGITLTIGKIVNTERTILPTDWDNDTAGKLTYVLLGKKAGDAGYATLKTFSYSELTSGIAIVNLELTIWDLKLVGYITEGDEADTSKPCLEKELTNVDFTTGQKTVTFDLKPVETTDATGSVNVEIAWLTDQPKRLEFGIYASSTDTATIVEDKGRTKVADSSETTSKKLSKITTAFSGSGGSHTEGWQEDDNVKAGMYKFAAVFYDATTDGNVIGYYIDYLYVDGGNLSKATVNYGDKFNTVPDNPTWLAVKTVFVPQELTATAVSVNDWYLAEFHWNDNSNNETGFELVINDGTSDTVVNPTNLTESLLYPTDSDFTGSGLSSATNTLDAGRTHVVLKLTTEKKYTAKIRAINGFTPDSATDPDAKFCENLNRNGDGQGRSYAPIVTDGTGTTAKKQFGMFTVNYKLDGSQVAKESSTTGVSVTNYVVGFNYHSEQQDLMTDNVLETPHLVKTGYMFDHWQTTADPKTSMPVIEAKKIDNLDLEPVWKGRDVLVSVTLPSYTDAADVKIAADRNIDNTVSYKFSETENTVTVDAGASLSSPHFALTDSTGADVTVGTMSTSGSTWTWTLIKAPTPSFYCLQITGTYTDAGTGRTLTLSGNIYINVEN